MQPLCHTHTLFSEISDVPILERMFLYLIRICDFTTLLLFGLLTTCIIGFPISITSVTLYYLKDTISSLLHMIYDYYNKNNYKHKNNYKPITARRRIRKHRYVD